MGKTAVESACLSNKTVSHLKFLFFSTYTFPPVVLGSWILINIIMACFGMNKIDFFWLPPPSVPKK